MRFGQEHVDRYVETDGEDGHEWQGTTAPAWYLNLDAEPDTEVQVKGDRFRAHARTATPEEKPEMWQTMTQAWPD